MNAVLVYKYVMWNFDVFFEVSLNNLLKNSRVAGDLRCYDIRVTSLQYVYKRILRIIVNKIT